MFRYKFGLNLLKTKREREREAGAIISVLTQKLQDGWNPINDDKDEKDESVDISVIKAFDNVLSIKRAYITPRTYKTYYDHINLFKKWLVQKKMDKLYVQNITNVHLMKYLDYLLRDKKYCGKTYNGHLGILKCFFNAFLDRSYIEKSPVVGIKQVRQDTGKNTTYSHLEEKLLEKNMYIHEKNFFYATRFVRFCFFRRSELSKLQIKHINWDNKTIIVPSE